MLGNADLKPRICLAHLWINKNTELGARYTLNEAKHQLVFYLKT